MATGVKRIYACMSIGAGEERTRSGEEEMPSAISATLDFPDNCDEPSVDWEMEGAL